MIPFSVLYTKEIKIYAQVEVVAKNVEDAISACKKLIESRKVSFRRKSVSFGNIEVDPHRAKFFASRVNDTSFTVGVSYGVFATASAEILAQSIELAQIQIPNESFLFTYLNVPLTDIQPNPFSYSITEVLRTPAQLSVVPPYSAGAGTTANISVQLLNGNSGIAELYRDGVYQKSITLTGVGQIIQTDPLDYGNNIFQLKYLGNEELSKSNTTFNIVAAGFPSSVSTTEILHPSYYFGDLILLPVQVDNASSHIPTGRVKIVSPGDIQSSEDLTEDTSSIGRSSSRILYFPQIGTYTPTLSYSGDTLLAASEQDLTEIEVLKVPTDIEDGYEFTPSIIESGVQFTIRGVIRCVSGQQAPQSGTITAEIGPKKFDGYCYQGMDGESLLYIVYVGPLPTGSYDANITFIPYGDRWSSATSTVSIQIDQGVESGDPPLFTSATSVQTTGGVSTFTGSKFALDSEAIIDGQSCTTEYESNTTLKVNVPPKAPGLYSVEVVQSTGTTGVIPSGLTVVSSINLISATDSDTSGGYSTWIGSGFASDAVAYIDGSPMTTSYVSPTELTVTIPAGLSVGYHDGYVSQSSGTSNTVTAIINIIAVFDPSQIEWTGWWEQRGDISDYSQSDTDGAGPDIAKEWEGRSSAGTSAGRNIGDTTFVGQYAPPTGTSYGGRPCVDFSGSYTWLDAKLSSSNFINSSSFSINTIAQVPSNITDWTNVYYSNKAIMSVYGDFMGVVVGKTGSYYYVAVYVYDGVGTSTSTGTAPSVASSNGYRSIRFLIQPDAWFMLQVKLEGGQLKARINNGDWWSLASGNPTNITGKLLLGSNGAGAGGKRLMSFQISNIAIPDSTFEDLYQYYYDDNPALLLPDPNYLDMTVRNLGIYSVVDDYDGVTTPIIVSSRKSAGDSGLKRWSRYVHNFAAGTGNDGSEPTITTISGKKRLISIGDSAMAASNATESASYNTASIFGTPSDSFHLTIAFTSSELTGTTGNTGKCVFGSIYHGFQVVAVSDGRVGLCTLNAAGSTYMYVALPAGTAVLNQDMVLSIQRNGATNQARVRVGKNAWGAWTASEAYSTGSVAALMDKAFSGTAFKGQFGGVVVEKGLPTDSEADKIVDVIVRDTAFVLV